LLRRLAAGELKILEPQPLPIHYLTMFFAAISGAFLAAYLVGSFPAGYLAGLACGVDLRTAGSGNVGATNALRVLGKKWGYAVFATDLIKGFLGVKVAQWLGGAFVSDAASVFGVAGAVGAVVGHNFPVWLGFRGGKGISTSGGVMLALFPLPVFAAGFVAWMGLFFSTRYVSIASLGAAIALPLASAVLWLNGKCPLILVIAAVAMCCLAFYRHRPNIRNLLNGTERRFGQKKTESIE